jgi:branched-chain amino acid transport system ATP-binding protein
VLNVDNLSVSYGPIKALHGVSLRVEKGEIVTLLGANGAGKSSLLRGITGLIPATGTVRFQGQDLSSLPAAQRVAAGIAMAPEGRQVFTDQTVHDNLRLGGYLIRKDVARVNRNIALYYNMFPRLEERREQMAGTLS